MHPHYYTPAAFRFTRKATPNTWGHPKLMTDTEQICPYELMLIVSGELTESDQQKAVGEIRKFLQDNTKGITFEDIWGRRDLAYKIKKQRRGCFVVFNFNAAASVILELRSNIRLNSNVLRHLLIAVPIGYKPVHHEEADSSMDELLKEELPSGKTAKSGAVKKRIVPKELERKETSAAEEKIVEPREPEVLKEEKDKRTIVAGKEEEEELKHVEEKLEKILENPDIDIR